MISAEYRPMPPGEAGWEQSHGRYESCNLAISRTGLLEQSWGATGSNSSCKSSCAGRWFLPSGIEEMSKGVKDRRHMGSVDPFLSGYYQLR